MSGLYIPWELLRYSYFTSRQLCLPHVYLQGHRAVSLRPQAAARGSAFKAYSNRVMKTGVRRPLAYTCDAILVPCHSKSLNTVKLQQRAETYELKSYIE